MKEIKDYSLLPHNTFGMDVKASLFVEYESVTELQSILSDKKLMAGNWLHIGGGSNLLFKGDYAGTVLHSAIRRYEVVAENEQEIEVRAGAGEVWDDFVAYTVKNSWYGAENLSLIPGEVGASAVQNIGAYGVEAKDFKLPAWNNRIHKETSGISLHPGIGQLGFTHGNNHLPYILQCHLTSSLFQFATHISILQIKNRLFT